MLSAHTVVLDSVQLDAKFLELPFDDGSTTFTIVLPNARDGLVELEKQIDKVLATTDFGQKYVQVSLPTASFKIERTLLETPLKTLGVQNIWSNSADLSGMAGVPGELRANRILQSSYIKADETGVEAIVDTSVELRVTEEHNVVADHPFLFYIKYKGIIVFVGRRVRY
ncbi:hypothetical protein Zmor_022308 [Zophobas morio]|uniref:Serpin domain-containing protein n=2 Tax=Zophobas morio TaxID=2755281 RepID=A0AA38M6M0_9CUCU|nr:hypothetical protein Zmor_022308 [Zophobas morio]